MNREILFRGKSQKGNFVFGYLVKYATGKHSIHYPDEAGVQISVPVIPETVNQYTGVDDQIEAKIFDSDICTSNEVEMPFVVKWDNTACAYLAYIGNEKAPFSWLSDLSDLKKIGNIYDNPELLKTA